MHSAKVQISLCICTWIAKNAKFVYVQKQQQQKKKKKKKKKERKNKNILIRLHGCIGIFESSLGAHARMYVFSKGFYSKTANNGWAVQLHTLI